MSYKALRARAISLLGSRCVCCGEARLMRLEIDHIYGDGAAHRRGAGRNICAWIVENTALARGRVRILCGNCHEEVTRAGACLDTSHAGVRREIDHAAARQMDLFVKIEPPQKPEAVPSREATQKAAGTGIVIGHVGLLAAQILAVFESTRDDCRRLQSEFGQAAA